MMYKRTTPRVALRARVSVGGCGAVLLLLLLPGAAGGQTARELEGVFWREVRCEEAREVEAYLKKYPDGAYVAEAQACLAVIAQRVAAEEAEQRRAEEAEQRRTRELEGVFWQQVRCEEAREVEAYLKEYPDGAYVAEAQACLAVIAQRVAEEENLGLDRQARVRVQQGLTALNYPMGVTDGQFGPATRVALRRWQEARGFAATGYLTPTQAATLIAAGSEVVAQRAREAEQRRVAEEAERQRQAREAEQRRVAEEENLGLDRQARVRVQQGLTALNYPLGVADGQFGPATRMALRRWQEARGFAATGYLTPAQAATLIAAGSEVVVRRAQEAEQRRIQEVERRAREAEQRRIQEVERRRIQEVERRRAEAAEQQRRAQEAEQRRIQEVERRRAEAAEQQRRAQEAERQREANELVNTIGMEFVRIEAGTFQMGSPARRTGRAEAGDLHTVRISQPFYLGKYEVTQGQWRAVLGDNPAHFTDCGDICPVENVSWEDARAFIRELNLREGVRTYRLPTEAEWEYATRAGTRTAYSFGNAVSRLGAYGWYSGNSEKRTHPVGEKRPNAWGLYDLHGNVWEWVTDWYGDYPSDRVTNPRGPSAGTSRVTRGGSWNHTALNCRAGTRAVGPPRHRSSYVGFRLARTP